MLKLITCSVWKKSSVCTRRNSSGLRILVSPDFLGDSTHIISLTGAFSKRSLDKLQIQEVVCVRNKVSSSKLLSV